jgi:ribosomal protein S18 acetylase RimI-like enzyme
MRQIFRFEALSGHDRSSFSCGVPALEGYFKNQASQDVRRRVASCSVMIDDLTESIAGFYTLSACHVLREDIDRSVLKKLPRYPEIPSVRLGRLAVDEKFRSIKLGSALLSDAVNRSLGLQIGAALMVVDAKDDTAAAFYRHHGFLDVPERPRQLVALLASLAG